MLFRSNLSEKSISLLAFTISISFHTLIFGVITSHKSWKEQISDPIPIELVTLKEERSHQEIPKAEEPPIPTEPVVERELEKAVSLPPPPLPKEVTKKAPIAEKKGKTSRISPLITKQYDRKDSDAPQVPLLSADKKLDKAPPAIIPEPVMGTTPDKGTGASEDVSSTIKEMALGGNQGPSFKDMVKPEYPEFARRLGQEGYVLLKVLVDEAGRPRRVEVIKSGGKAFDEAAVEAIKKSSFYPAREKGVPIPCYVKIPIRFQLVQR
ncbi:MAG: energy transducer TonB [Syntrophobacterales bacterium]|nr:energy transducer TonB [Syntrophobacterales bacterium]